MAAVDKLNSSTTTHSINSRYGRSNLLSRIAKYSHKNSWFSVLANSWKFNAFFNLRNFVTYSRNFLVLILYDKKTIVSNYRRLQCNDTSRDLALTNLSIMYCSNGNYYIRICLKSHRMYVNCIDGSRRYIFTWVFYCDYNKLTSYIC